MPPVQRGLPAGLARVLPAIGEPEFGAVVAAIENERQVVGVTHRTVGQAEGFEEYSMARALAVEGKGLVAVTELQQAAGMLQPAQRGGRLRCLRSGQVLTVGRLQR